MTDRSTRVVIIGTGFAGLGMAARLRGAGYSEITILEKQRDLGGAWRDNTYPGAACDVPSHLYSFSFFPKDDWTKAFAPQPEIEAYVKAMAEHFDLRRHCVFDTEVASSVWDGSARSWTVTSTDGRTWEAELLVAATGQLSLPSIPDVPGRHTFGGPQFHSARWDDTVSLGGKRVTVIGTGASAIQFVPHVAREAAHTHVLQRSAPWIIPKPDREIRGLERLAMKVTPLRLLHRGWLYAKHDLRWPFFRRQDHPALRIYARVAERHLASAVTDPDLVRALTPTDAMGCKRILISNDWYPAIARDDVTLVEGGAVAIEPDAVVVSDGRRIDTDVIIWGTGFRSTDFLVPMKVTGRDGRALDEVWRDGASAHLGISVHGFPNLAILYGPNTNLGHNSILQMLEAQFHHVLSMLDAVSSGAHGQGVAEVRESAQRRFDAKVQRQLARSVYNAGCTSWYRDDAGRISNNWSGTATRYHWLCRRPLGNAYDVTGASSS